MYTFASLPLFLREVVWAHAFTCVVGLAVCVEWSVLSVLSIVSRRVHVHRDVR